MRQVVRPHGQLIGVRSQFFAKTGALLMRSDRRSFRELKLQSRRYGVAVVGLHFVCEDLDFELEGFQFALFSGQKSVGQQDAVGQSGGGEQVAVFALAFVVVQHRDRYQAFFDQGSQAVIEAAQAHAQVSGQFSLRHVGFVLQQSQHPKDGVFLQLRLATGHFSGLGQATAVPGHLGSGLTAPLEFGSVQTPVRTCTVYAQVGHLWPQGRSIRCM